MSKKKKSIFHDGPISPDFIAKSISNHQSKTEIGAHEIFLGQVRADEIEGKTVTSIDYSAHMEMADEAAYVIREKAFDKFKISCLHIHHSIGNVNVGEICFFVFASSGHRSEARNAVAFLVDEIKKEVPIFGKEIFQDQSHQWKTNTAT